MNDKSPNILLVDDDPVFRRVTSITFTQAGFSIVTGDTLNAALQMIEEREFQVAVIDYKLTDGTGIDFFERTRRTHPNMVRILLTAYTTEEVLKDAINRGEVFRYIRKPVHTGLLLSSVQQALELHELVTSRAHLLQQLERQNRELKQKNEDLRLAYKQMGDLKHLQDQILNLLSEPVLLIGGGEHILSCNQSACRMLGYTRGEMLGKSLADLFPAREELPRYVRSALDADGAYGFEAVLSRKDGTASRVTAILNVLRTGEAEEDYMMALLIKAVDPRPE